MYTPRSLELVIIVFNLGHGLEKRGYSSFEPCTITSQVPGVFLFFGNQRVYHKCRPIGRVSEFRVKKMISSNQCLSKVIKNL